MNNKDEILKAYNFRHACKEFNGNEIPKEDFEFILETGRLSPSSFGFEPWQFIVVQNKELREKIKEYSWGGEKQIPTSSHFVIILGRKKKHMLYDSKYINDFMREVQELPDEVRDMKRGFYKAFQEKDFNLLEGERAIFDWACKQTYIALGNMMTSAAEIGIDSCPIEGFNMEKLDELLEREGIMSRDDFGVSVMVAFGYRKKDPRGKTRQNLNDIVTYIE
nr:NAD(P)H-dependent oxidoreductase [Clostridium hydrogeniformans]